MPRFRSSQSLLIRRRWTADDARTALAALAESGLSASAFAACEGIDVQRLRRWRRSLAAAAAPARTSAPRPAPAFVEVVARPSGAVEVVLLSGRVLRVAESVDARALGRIAAVLEELPRC